ncbi:rhodanese-like domain-containing protein [Bacillus aerolatus]|uniref:Rhodanese-like domain-containing protein n=1 Tax=Bacillus aerolatus TaxID=2653354 RepID=A0A6I1FDK4_9BACI|nr:rhodanese-like domain-containing protein [Bacillus aerolatus]KAB7705570.1 rhodanese-like domain-containing protein [Bacillus aerolatus]
MVIALGIIILLALPVLYRRYVPVVGAEKIAVLNKDEDTLLVDVRDFHVAHHDPITSAIQIPLPYLARQHNEIAKKEIVVIVSDKVLRNLSIRQLKKYGFDVKGYWCKKDNDRDMYMTVSAGN